MIASVFSALVNGLLQGTVLIVLAALVLRRLPRLNAATAGAIWSAVFIIAAALPLADYQHPVLRPPAAAVLDRTIAQGEPTGRALNAIVNGPSPDVHPQLAAVRQTAMRLAAVVQAPLIGLWALVTAVLLLRLARGYAELGRLKGCAHPLPSGIADGIAPPGIRIALSAEIMSACAIGFANPTILLPEADVVALGRDDLARIIRHECAHLRRRDDWANLVQRIVGAVYFFHPALRYASRRIDDLRELACDDAALDGHSAAESSAYARTLAAVVERARRARGTTYAPAFGQHRSQVFRRVEHVLDEHGDRSTRVRRTGLAFIAAVLVVAAIVVPLQIPRAVTISHDTMNVADASTDGGALLDALAAAGYGHPSAEQIVALTNADVTAAKVVFAREAGSTHPSIDALIELVNNDVSPEFTTAIERAVPGISAADIVRLSNTDASASKTIALARALGGDVDVDALVKLLDNDVTADFITRLAAHGYKRLPADQLIALKDSGFQP